MTRFRTALNVTIGVALTIAPLAAQQPPDNVSVSPSSGSGLTQSFSFVSSSAAGSASMVWQQMIFNFAVDGGAACDMYVGFDPGQNAGTAYLALDTGNAWAGSGAVGTPGTIQNSQCQLNLGASSVTWSGNTVTTVLALTFEAGLPGPQNIYLITGDASGLNTGWQQMGTWTTSAVIDQPPSLVSAVPNAGGGLAQTFSYTASSVNGYSYLTAIEGLINTAVDGAGACYVAYVRSDNALFLINDAGTAAIGSGVVIGSPGTLANSQCTVDAGASRVVMAGNSLTLNIAVTFNSSWTGPKNNYMWVEDRGSASAGWTQMGTWTVGPAPAAYDPRRTGTRSGGSYWGRSTR